MKAKVILTGIKPQSSKLVYHAKFERKQSAAVSMQAIISFH